MGFASCFEPLVIQHPAMEFAELEEHNISILAYYCWYICIRFVDEVVLCRFNIFSSVSLICPMMVLAGTTVVPA